MSDNEFPRVLYKDGSQEEAWGKMVDLHHVHDHDELDAALADGWSMTPDGAPAKPEYSLLNENTVTIVEHLPALTKDELTALLEAEKIGKKRKGVIGPIEEAIAALDAA